MPSNPTTKLFFTVAEFAKISGDSVSTVRREIRAGNLPFRQSGPHKKIKIPVEALNVRSEVGSATPGEQISKAEQIQDSPEKISGPSPTWLD